MPRYFRRRVGYGRRRSFFRSRLGARRSKYRYFRRRYGNRRRRPARWFARRYNYKERFEEQKITINTPTVVYWKTFTMQANLMPTWGNRKVWADQYKIYKWKINIIPDRCQAPTLDDNGDNSNELFQIASCRHALVYDFNDANTPTSWDQFIMHPRARVKNFSRPLKLIIRPAILKAAYELGISTGTGWRSGHGWIKIQDEQVPHYGFKYGLNLQDWQPAIPSTYLGIRVRHTVYWGLKNINCTI